MNTPDKSEDIFQEKLTPLERRQKLAERIKASMGNTNPTGDTPEEVFLRKMQSNRPVSRRAVVGVGLGALAVAGLSFIGLGKLFQSSPSKTEAAPQNTPTATATQNNEQSKVVEHQPNKELLNKIIILPLDSADRKKLEREYFNQVQTLEDIDLGLGTLFYYKNKDDNNYIIRKQLLDKRFQLRKAGHPKLKSIGDDREKWVEKRGIYPESFGICLDAYPKARRVIEFQLKKRNGWKNFRPDLVYDESIGRFPKGHINTLTADDLMINIAGMTRLVCTETGIGAQTDSVYSGKKVLVSYGFTNLGNKPALTGLNSERFPKAKKALETLCERAKALTGINYNAGNHPGSIQETEDASGGAIGVQMMPSNMLDMADMFAEAGESFNFTDVTDLAAVAWVFLAQGKRDIEKFEEDPQTKQKTAIYATRYGYLRGGDYSDFAVRTKALLKWNQSSKQKEEILDDANAYYNIFLDSQRYAA